MGRRSLTAAAVVVCLGAGGAASWAAFFSSATNSDNSAATAASFAHLQMQTGSYTGNGADNRNMSVTSFQPDVVMIKGSTAQIAVMRTSTMTGDLSKLLAGGTALANNHVQSLTATGFQLGNNARVNASGVTYQWVAFRAAADVLRVGTYTGNGGSQTIAGAGFSPEYVAVLPAGTGRPSQRLAGSSRSYRFEAETGVTNRITALTSDGFSVGSHADANASGVAHHYIAFNQRGATVGTGSYTGTGAARDITGVGFQPQWVVVRADDAVTARAGRHRSASLATTASQHFAATADGTGALTALEADGFELGTTADVNANGVTYRYAAFRAR